MQVNKEGTPYWPAYRTATNTE